MSRRTRFRFPVRAVLALMVGAASLVGLGQAAAAPPATFAVTGVSPSYVEAESASPFGVTLSGKGFTRATVVEFGGCTDDGLVVPPTSATATKLVVKPPKCAVGPVDLTVTNGAASAVLKGKFAFLAPPVVEALAPATDAVLPVSGPWTGGTAATVTVKDDVPAKAVVQVLVTTDEGVTKPVAGKVEAGNAKRIAFKVPPGTPGDTPSVAVSVFGIASEPVAELFTYRSTVKTTPNAWVKGAVAPSLKVDGAGFGKGTPTVTVCGVAAPLVTGKAPTDKSLLVTPPAWSAVAAAGVDVDNGGVCTVKVAVAGGETSVITGGSTCST